MVARPHDDSTNQPNEPSSEVPSDYQSVRRNNLLPEEKKWIPETREVTNREGLEILQRHENDRQARIDRGERVAPRRTKQNNSLQRVLYSLTSGVHKVHYESAAEEREFCERIKGCVEGGREGLSKDSLRDVLNVCRPKCMAEGLSFFDEELRTGKILVEDVARIVTEVKKFRAAKKIDEQEALPVERCPLPV